MSQRGKHPNSLEALKKGNDRQVKCLCGKCRICYHRVYCYEWRRGLKRRKK